MVFVDIDDTLGDFTKHVENSLGKLLGDKLLAIDNLWGQFSTLKHHIPQIPRWWETMPVISGSSILLRFIKEHFDSYKILSAYPEWDERAKNAKIYWCQEKLGIPSSQIILCKRSEKKNYAVSNGIPNILIDDYDKNIKEWQSAGGIGIHFQYGAQTISELRTIIKSNK